MKTMDYTPKEMMAIAAARTIRNDDIVFCGTGISMLAAMAAKHISAPDSVIFFETGAIDSRLAELPLAVADPRVMYRTAVNGSLLDSFATMQNRATGRRVVGILGAAQIDPYGNLNSTVIGDYARPKVRFSGSGGASDVASFVDRTIIFMQHEKRKFVPEVDYLTSPGWLSGGHTRQEQGLCRGGPALVVTNLGVMGFDEKDHRMFLRAVYPGVSVEDVVANTGFAIEVARREPMPPPSTEELRVLREVCDPQRLILG
jgi:glutaconate CoA-transferase subunit B